MTSDRRPPAQVSGQTKVKAALTLFDESLDRLSRHLPAQPQGRVVTGAALPSLLAQCEQHLVSARQRRGPRLLVVLPGLPHLDPDWWRVRVSGLEVIRLAWGAATEPALYRADAAARGRMIRTLVRELSSDCRRAGRDLLFLASPVEALDLGLDPENMSLLVGDPWRAFGEGQTTAQPLDEMCKDTLSLIEARPDLPILYLERNGQQGFDQPPNVPSRDIGLAVLDALGLAHCWSPGVDADAGSLPSVGDPHPLLPAFSPALAELCARLGYPLPSGPAAEDPAIASVVTPPQHAKVSAFIKRVKQLQIAGCADDDRLLYRLTGRLDTLLSSNEGAFLDRFDAVTQGLGWRDAVVLHLMAAAHFTVSQDFMQALGLIGEALDHIPPRAAERPALRLLAASLYLDLNAPRVAMETVLADLAGPDTLSPTGRRAMESIIGVHGAEHPEEHGQALLLHSLSIHPPMPIARKRLMVEIGTTRETVPGQGSTRQLALLCAREGFDFVTVDMDPRNSRKAMRMFRQIGLPFQAVTSKGEDWLASYPAQIDFVFLDAYDFDHGMHSELRQERYERYLGARIDEAACHQMHLDCAQALIDRLSPDGLICFDDTWTDPEGQWTAKGTTAMPFLLRNGFKVIEARNRAALLCRVT